MKKNKSIFDKLINPQSNQNETKEMIRAKKKADRIVKKAVEKSEELIEETQLLKKDLQRDLTQQLQQESIKILKQDLKQFSSLLMETLKT